MANSCLKAKSFFGTVQCIYILFSSSTKRWKILQDNVKSLTLKPLSQTRSLQKNLHLETDNSVSNPSRNKIPDGLETEFSVLKTLVCDFDRL